MLVALAVAVLLHLVLLWLLRELMLPGSAPPTTRIELVLLEPEPAPSPLPQPQPLPEPQPPVEPPPLPDAAPEPAAVQRSDPPTTPAPPPPTAPRPDPPPTVTTTAPRSLQSSPIRLYRPDGAMVLPDGVVDPPQPIASYIPVPREVPPWEQRPVALVYEESLFEAYWWVPRDESLAGAFFRKATVTREFRLPGGRKVRCTWVLMIGGCAW